jgi:hypothetical protein
MTASPDPQVAPTYTRASVMAYLAAAEAERQRLRLAIADARSRTASARRRVDRLASLTLEPDHIVPGRTEDSEPAPHPVPSFGPDPVGLETAPVAVEPDDWVALGDWPVPCRGAEYRDLSDPDRRNPDRRNGDVEWSVSGEGVHWSWRDAAVVPRD